MCIVDAVAGHGHDFAVRLQGLDDAELLLRHDPREDRRGAHVQSKLGFAELLELRPGEEVRRIDARLAGDGPCSGRVVARDHDHPDACRPALAHCLRHALAERIGKAHKTNELEDEVVLRVRPGLPGE
jgi:hypothetical protein